MKVWIDQDLCTGDGLCEEIAPDIFTILDDGLAYVKDATGTYDGHDEAHPPGQKGLVDVPGGQEGLAIESSEECPGECIFVEPA